MKRFAIFGILILAAGCNSATASPACQAEQVAREYQSERKAMGYRQARELRQAVRNLNADGFKVVSEGVVADRDRLARSYRGMYDRAVVADSLIGCEVTR